MYTCEEEFCMNFNNELFKASLYNLQTKLNGLNESQPTVATDMSKFKYYSFLQAYNDIVQFIYQLPVDQLEAIGDELTRLDTEIQTLTQTVNTYTGKVDAALDDIEEFKNTINSQITNINSLIININQKIDTSEQKIHTIEQKIDTIGDVSNLKTSDKTNVVAAINEVFNKIDMTATKTTLHLTDTSNYEINEKYSYYIIVNNIVFCMISIRCKSPGSNVYPFNENLPKSLFGDYIYMTTNNANIIGIRIDSNGRIRCNGGTVNGQYDNLYFSYPTTK